jgi:hypothetical protein
MRAKFFFALLLGFCILVGFARASDLPKPTLPATAVSIDQALLERAVLFLIREKYDVLSADDAQDLLATEAKSLSALGIQADEEAAIQRQLSAEGSYFIVSLQYLIGVGGANWPTDKPASSYDRDASRALAELQDRWFDTVASHGDILTLIRQVDTIDAQTEGQPAATGDYDHFKGAEAMVKDALRYVRSAT